MMPALLLPNLLDHNRSPFRATSAEACQNDTIRAASRSAMSSGRIRTLLGRVRREDVFDILNIGVDRVRRSILQRKCCAWPFGQIAGIGVLRDD